MVLKDYIDSNKLQALQSSYAEIAGLDAAVYGVDGERLAGRKGFQKEETESFDIIVNGDKLGSVVIEKSSDKNARTAAELLCTQISQAATLELLNNINSGRFDSIKSDIKKSGELVQMINEKTGHLKGIAKKQTILSLNATIEAARSGEAGVGFAVVAKSMQDLSGQSAGIYTDIETSVEEITNLINSIIEAFK
ncbi:MAG: methyl-accepting chemotaxis protein [Lachnospiraceae bacterium]|jgi:methyl-accepting chemotaxis protein|nr:methyl-accepting chemotaxis protein [Lachnospiraceae bacterium]HBV82371.1 hypothetical protein [Lachnospiraceae bacterium]